jgi:hypothetical protein
MVSNLFRTQECDFRRGSTPLASALESTANGWQVVLKTIVRLISLVVRFLYSPCDAIDHNFDKPNHQEPGSEALC